MHIILRTLLTLFFTTFLSAHTQAEIPGKETSHKNVLFLLSEKQPAYQQLVLSAKSYLKGAHSSADMRFLNTLYTNDWLDDDTLDKSRYRLLVAVGTKACGILLGERESLTSARILCAFVPRETFQKLLQRYKIQVDEYESIAAIFMDQPIQRQLAFAKQIVPSAHRLGTILNPEDSKNIPIMKKIAVMSGFELDVVLYDDRESVRADIKHLISDNDILLAIPDPQVHSPNFAKWLLYNAYYEKKPVIAFSKSYVTAGALGSIYSTPEQIGKQVGEYVSAWLNRELTRMRHLSEPRYFSIAINHAVADSMGLKIPPQSVIQKKLENQYLKFSYEETMN